MPAIYKRSNSAAIMQLYHYPDLSLTTFFWEGPEFHHAVHVMRLGTGATVHLTDGKGHLAEAVVQHIEKKKCRLEVISMTTRPPVQPAVHLFVAPTKQIDRMEWLIEKATEIGVQAFHPFTSFHSERRSIRQDRLQHIALSAMKQSHRTYLPEVHALTDWKSAMATAATLPVKFIAHASGSSALKTFPIAPEPAALLIGPEGDFSDQELQDAIIAGFTKVHLGTYRLRTESAALMAAAALLS